jgi:hypothetical protein
MTLSRRAGVRLAAIALVQGSGATVEVPTPTQVERSSNFVTLFGAIAFVVVPLVVLKRLLTSSPTRPPDFLAPRRRSKAVKRPSGRLLK